MFSPTIFHTYFGATSGAVSDPGIIGDSGWNNSVLYSTPNFGGLTANFIYGFGEQPGAPGKNKWGGNVPYFSGPFAATVADASSAHLTADGIKFSGSPPAACKLIGDKDVAEKGWFNA